MTTSPVASISDDELNEITAFTDGDYAADFEEVRGLKAGQLRRLIARLRASEAVCDDLRGDADRYRWLRDEANRTREDAPQVLITDWSGSPVSIQPWAYPQGEELDSAIDSAMEQQP